MLGLEGYLHRCGLEKGLLNLVRMRVSQINGCAYCIDMHSKDLRAGGGAGASDLRAGCLAGNSILQ